MNESWYEVQLHLARVLELQWGVDLASTYGPWGYVGLSLFHPQTFHSMVLLNTLLLALTALRIAVFVERVLPSARPLGGLFMAACLLPLTSVVVHEWTALLFCPHLLAACIVLEWLSGRGSAAGWIDALSAVALGFLSLVKISVWPISLGVAAAAWLQPIQRRWLYTAGLAAGVLGGWLAAGQSWSGLGPFVETGWAVITGFKDGMALWSAELGAGLLLPAAVLGLLLLLAVSYRPTTLAAASAFVALAAVLGQILQSGLVRADPEHYVPNLMAVVSLVPLGLAAAWGAGTRRGRGVAAGWLACGAALLAFAPGTSDWARPVREARAFVRFLGQGAHPLASRRELRLAELRAAYPLDARRLAGPGGILGGDPAILESHAVPFTLQPTVTTYASYTPALQALNAAWIENPERLAWLLWCRPRAVDLHYPAESDGLAYLALLSHFGSEREVGDCLLLERSAPARLEPLSVGDPIVLRFGESLAVPGAAGGVLWAELTVRETWLGTLVRGLFKPSPVLLRVVLRNGRSVTHEVLPTMTARGFLLSPYLWDWRAVEAAARGATPPQSVSALEIVGWQSGPISSAWFYEPEARITLSSWMRRRSRLRRVRETGTRRRRSGAAGRALGAYPAVHADPGTRSGAAPGERTRAAASSRPRRR